MNTLRIFKKKYYSCLNNNKYNKITKLIIIKKLFKTHLLKRIYHKNMKY